MRILTMVDEFTRECLALYVARSIPSAKVISVLARVVARYGAPEFIRSDNGPEFIAQAVGSWILFQGAQTHHSGIGHLSPTEFYAAWLAGQT